MSHHNIHQVSNCTVRLLISFHDQYTHHASYFFLPYRNWWYGTPFPPSLFSAALCETAIGVRADGGGGDGDALAAGRARATAARQSAQSAQSVQLAQLAQSARASASNALRSSHFAQFEKHSTGFGSKMLLKMGFTVSFSVSISLKMLNGLYRIPFLEFISCGFCVYV